MSKPTRVKFVEDQPPQTTKASKSLAN